MHTNIIIKKYIQYIQNLNKKNIYTPIYHALYVWYSHHTWKRKTWICVWLPVLKWLIKVLFDWVGGVFIFPKIYYWYIKYIYGHLYLLPTSFWLERVFFSNVTILFWKGRRLVFRFVSCQILIYWLDTDPSRGPIGGGQRLPACHGRAHVWTRTTMLNVHARHLLVLIKW